MKSLLLQKLTTSLPSFTSVRCKIAMLLAVAGLGAFPLQAQNLFTNGTLEAWGPLTGTPPQGVPTGWSSGSLMPTQTPGLVAGSTYSALVSPGAGSQLFQTLVGNRPSSFQLDFSFAALDPGSASNRSFNLQLNTISSTNVITAVINLRLTQGSSIGKLTLQGHDGGSWVNIAANAFDASVYNLASNTFTTLNAYNFSVTGDFLNNTYSISYGLVGGSSTTLSNVNIFAAAPNASRGQVFAGVLFAGGNSQAAYAVDNVSVAAVPEPTTVGLAVVGSLGILIMTRRRNFRRNA